MRDSNCLRVGFSPYYPFVSPCVFDREKPCREIGKAGLNVDLVNILAGQVLGYSCISYVKSLQFRDYNQSKSPENWNGLIGMLLRDEIDVAGSLLYTNEDNTFPLVDYSLPITFTERGIVQSSLGTRKVNTIPPLLRPFRPTVWLLLLFASIVFILLNTLLLYSKQTGRKSPGTQNLLNLFLAMTAFVMFRVYKTGVIVGRVVQTSQELQFQSMHDVIVGLNAGNTRYLNLERFRHHFEANGTSRPWLHSVRKVYRQRPELFEFTENLQVVWSKITEGTDPSYVKLSTHSAFQLTAGADFPDLVYVPLPEYNRFLSFAFQKHSRLRHMFNWALYNKVYSGFDFDEEFTKAYSLRSNCRQCKHKVAPNVVQPKKPMKMVEFQAAVYIYAFIPVASGLVYAFELLFSKLTQS